MADILIRMEMPKTCQICRTAKFDRIVGCEEWDRLSIAQRMYMRSETCPLIPLPKGHGRLIDGTDLYAVLDGGFDVNLDDLPETKDAILNMIQSAETIVPAEGGGEE